MTIFIRTRRFFSVFTFYVLRFSVSVNAYAHAYAHPHPHSKTKHQRKRQRQRHLQRHLFHFTFFRLLSIMTSLIIIPK